MVSLNTVFFIQVGNTPLHLNNNNNNNNNGLLAVSPPGGSSPASQPKLQQVII